MDETAPISNIPTSLTKEQAIELFGGKQKDVAEAIGVTPSAISQWPDGELDRATVDRLVGAALRLGKLPTPASDQGRAAA
jgi:predicted XRE-type DNA-binding protein